MFRATALTPELIAAASRDAGNRSMEAAGRTKWSRSDYSVACKEWQRLARVFSGEQVPA